MVVRNSALVTPERVFLKDTAAVVAVVAKLARSSLTETLLVTTVPSFTTYFPTPETLETCIMTPIPLADERIAVKFLVAPPPDLKRRTGVLIW